MQYLRCVFTNFVKNLQWPVQTDTATFCLHSKELIVGGRGLFCSECEKLTLTVKSKVGVLSKTTWVKKIYNNKI